MRSISRLAAFAALLLSGCSALGLQVVWQRIISLHVGAEVASRALVVAVFLSGLALGSVVGGRLADRYGSRGSLRALASAEAGVAACAFVSPWLLGDVAGAPLWAGTWVGAVVTVTLLLVPTTLMGLTLPLAARVVAPVAVGAGREVGTLYALNTAGAAFGALVAGWRLVGTLGYQRAAWACAAISLASAACAAVGAARHRESDDPSEVQPAASPTPAAAAAGADDAPGGRRVWPWYLAYGVAGSVALGLEQTFFRIAGAVGRSNSYSFSTVLALYLVSFAAGTAVGSRLVTRVSDPGRTFLWLQAGVGVSALGGLAAVTAWLPRTGLSARLVEWFNTDGFASGYDTASTSEVLLFAVAIPAMLVVAPVALMGAGFPFLERAVVERRGHVGRRTGAILASSSLGNVAGVLLASFVLIDRLGTAGTHVLLAATSAAAAGCLAVARHAGAVRKVAYGGALLVVGGALLAWTPSNRDLWAFIVGHEPGQPEPIVVEDASCASIVERHGPTSFQLSVDGASQNGYAYDDFHVLIGLLPTLVRDRPGEAIAVGYGIGSTSYALLSDGRRERVTTVELCGGHYEATDRLATEGHREFVALRDDPRHERLVGDGRHHLLRSDEHYDTIVVDTLRITSASSGAHFSRDFYALVADSLTDDGVFAQWVPTWRVQNSAAQVFPYLVTAKVAEYGDSIFMLGSRSPIAVTGDELLARFEERAAAWYDDAQRPRLSTFLAGWQPTCVTDGSVVQDVAPGLTNTDLEPRDEFPYDNGFISEDQVVTTCDAGRQSREG